MAAGWSWINFRSRSYAVFLEFLTARKPLKSLYRALDQRQAIQRPLFTRGLFLQIPRVVADKKVIWAHPDGVTQYIGAARLVAGVDPRRVKRTRQVDHGITRTHRYRDAICQIGYRNRLQSMDSRIVVRTSVRVERPEVAAANVLHTASFGCDILQRHPNGD